MALALQTTEGTQQLAYKMLRTAAALALAAALPLTVDAFAPSGFVATRPSGLTAGVVSRGALPLRRSVGVARKARSSAWRLGLRMQKAPLDNEQAVDLEVSSGLDSAAAATGEEDTTFKDAVRDTSIAVAAATVFGAGIGATLGVDKALEYFTGYLLEESLSVDNLFVFLLLFEYFKVPAKEQKKVLNYGIWGAVAMRAAFIGAGLLAIEKFRGVLVGFAGLLIFSSYKILASTGQEEEEDEDLADNQVVKLVNKFVKSSPDYDGDKFFTEVDGVKLATPLLVVLICVELSDVIFAVDSIPAVFGVTEDPLIVFTSNIFAIASLRALYSVLAKLAQDLEYLDTAVGAVLGFIGFKLIGEYVGFEISEIASLGIVASLLGVGVGTSLHKKRKEDARAAKDEA